MWGQNHNWAESWRDRIMMGGEGCPEGNRGAPCRVRSSHPFPFRAAAGGASEAPMDLYPTPLTWLGRTLGEARFQKSKPLLGR